MAERVSPPPAQAYLRGEGAGLFVLVPAATAAWLLEATDFPDRRKQTRGMDAHRDVVLGAITHAGLLHRTATASDRKPVLAVPPPRVSGLDAMSSAEAGVLLGMSDRAVRAACVAGRVLASRTEDGRWRIAAVDVEDYRRRRAA